MFHMEQILTIKILELLLKEKLHAREIAKRLKINHTTILRKLKKMVEANVIDFEQAGKNKVFFVKKSLEAKTYVFIMEFFKLIEFIRSYPQLKRVVALIQKNDKVKLAVIFGSYAKFQAKKGSDIDIFIETDDEKLKKEIESLDSRLSVKIGIYDSSNPLIKEIEKDHVIVKGVEEFYEKSKFFE